MVNFILKQANIDCSFFEKVKLILLPALKGYVFSLLCGGLFIALFYLISNTTQYSLIGGLWGGDSTATNDQYRGRNGLTMCVAGFFILASGISQAFKVPSSD